MTDVFQLPVKSEFSIVESEVDAVEFDEKDWYNLAGIQNKCGISEGALKLNPIEKKLNAETLQIAEQIRISTSTSDVEGKIKF